MKQIKKDIKRISKFFEDSKKSHKQLSQLLENNKDGIMKDLKDGKPILEAFKNNIK